MKNKDCFKGQFIATTTEVLFLLLSIFYSTIYIFSDILHLKQY